MAFRWVRTLLDKEPVVFVSCLIGGLGVSMPFWVTPMRRQLGYATYQVSAAVSAPRPAGVRAALSAPRAPPCSLARSLRGRGPALGTQPARHLLPAGILPASLRAALAPLSVSGSRHPARRPALCPLPAAARRNAQRATPLNPPSPSAPPQYDAQHPKAHGKVASTGSR